MISNSIKPLNVLCIVGYLLFMTLAIDSAIVDGLAVFVAGDDGTLLFKQTSPENTLQKSKLAALQFKAIQVGGEEKELATQTYMINEDRTQAAAGVTSGISKQQYALASTENSLSSSALIETPESPASFTAPPPDSIALTDSDGNADEEEDDEADCANFDAGDDDSSASGTTYVDTAKSNESRENNAATLSYAMTPTLPAGLIEPAFQENPAGDIPKISILKIVEALPVRRWRYDLDLDRYVVNMDSETKVVMTIRPSLQHLVEEIFKHYTPKLGAAVIQDPSTGAILALTSFDGKKALSPDSSGFIADNWALKATFPVASIFKIITASAGIDRGKVVPASRIRIGSKASIELWRAFAKSHNGAFGVVGRAVGASSLLSYANAFGFNRPFYFDLPVGRSIAEIPEGGSKLGEAAAGLKRDFIVSPMHVSNIVSTILNRGRTMKPYLVDYVLYKDQVVFRRKPFPLAQPIPDVTAAQIYEMMRTTPIHGTAKRGFGCYKDCPQLASLCGGKTGTLTGMNPNYLFTWFGGFTKTGGRDIAITVLVGQSGYGSTRAVNLAGRIAYTLYNGANESRKKNDARLAGR